MIVVQTWLLWSIALCNTTYSQHLKLYSGLAQILSSLLAITANHITKYPGFLTCHHKLLLSNCLRQSTPGHTQEQSRSRGRFTVWCSIRILVFCVVKQAFGTSKEGPSIIYTFCLPIAATTSISRTNKSVTGQGTIKIILSATFLTVLPSSVHARPPEIHDLDRA